MKYTAAILALSASGSAHMILKYPAPYGQPNNSPLDNSGSDFPCKATGPESYTVTTMNEWNAGETKQVSFTGSAVHGGGSCQFSLTTDKAPTKNTQWKVIHSVIGGCPSDAPGNLAENAGGSDASKFDVTLPSDLPAGEYTFAWTWFNKIGNREMYMNCAPLKVGGGAGKSSTADASGALSSLPDMFVANLPREECATSDSQDVVFPNPGQSVEMGAKAVKGSVSGPGCAAMEKMGAGSGNMGSPSPPSDSPAPSGPAAGPPAVSTPATPSNPTPVPSNPGGVFAPGASSAAPAPPAAPTGAPSQPGNNTPPASGSPPSSGSGTPCTNDGAIVCIGSNSFGLCNQGFAVPQALAAGTTCSNGQIARRSVRFPRAALHRRHGSNLI